MNADEFWALIDAIHVESGGDMDAKVEMLTARLKAMEPGQILEYSRHFDACMDRAYSWDLWGAAYVIQGGCSDDAFMDFRSSLISMGRSLFEASVANPDGMAELDAEIIDALQFEGFQYPPGALYEEKSGHELERSSPHPADPTGEEWDEEPETLKRRFPRLWQRFGAEA
jgi:hypothetical protein